MTIIWAFSHNYSLIETSRRFPFVNEAAETASSDICKSLQEQLAAIGKQKVIETDDLRPYLIPRLCSESDLSHKPIPRGQQKRDEAQEDDEGEGL